MNTNISAAGLRQWAAQCEARAQDPLTTGDENERLMKMSQALIDLAHNQEWLDGQKRANGQLKDLAS